jgi:hypothetical protein
VRGEGLVVCLKALNSTPTCCEACARTMKRPCSALCTLCSRSAYYNRCGRCGQCTVSDFVTLLTVLTVVAPRQVSSLALACRRGLRVRTSSDGISLPLLVRLDLCMDSSWIFKPGSSLGVGGWGLGVGGWGLGLGVLGWGFWVRV